MLDSLRRSSRAHSVIVLLSDCSVVLCLIFSFKVLFINWLFWRSVNCTSVILQVLTKAHSWTESMFKFNNVDACQWLSIEVNHFLSNDFLIDFSPVAALLMSSVQSRSQCETAGTSKWINRIKSCVLHHENHDFSKSLNRIFEAYNSPFMETMTFRESIFILLHNFLIK